MPLTDWIFCDILRLSDSVTGFSGCLKKVRIVTDFRLPILLKYRS